MLGYDDNICFHTESAPPTFDTETLGLTLSPLLVREPAVAVWPRSRGCIWAAQGGAGGTAGAAAGGTWGQCIMECGSVWEQECYSQRTIGWAPAQARKWGLVEAVADRGNGC